MNKVDKLFEDLDKDILTKKDFEKYFGKVINGIKAIKDKLIATHIFL